MASLESYGKKVNSIFQLLGEKEDSITLSMSWALARCPEFLKAVVEVVTGVIIDPDKATVKNQTTESDAGRTDIEVLDEKNVHIIFEAKRGWVLPGRDQLTKYSVREDFAKSAVPHKHIVSLSECSRTYADLYLPHDIPGVPVSHLPYKEVYQLAIQSIGASNHEQKHLLSQFTDYLWGLMSMQKQDSNMVYVVALGTDKPNGCSISWIDIVQQHSRYFCPVGGNGWPKDPPNYIAFRYYGKLQSIHHIESYTVSRNMHDEIPEMPDEVWDGDCYIYHLGAAITPAQTVKTGKIYRNGRVWAMLDTLLTCETISEARDKTKERLG